MPAFSPQSSNSPAMQANHTPIVCVFQTPRKVSPTLGVSISATVLQSIE